MPVSFTTTVRDLKYIRKAVNNQSSFILAVDWWRSESSMCVDQSSIKDFPNTLSSIGTILLDFASKKFPKNNWWKAEDVLCYYHVPVTLSGTTPTQNESRAFRTQKLAIEALPTNKYQQHLKLAPTRVYHMYSLAF